MRGFRFKELAPQVGLEPTTLRLTAECSAIELLRNKRPHIVSNYAGREAVFIADGVVSVKQSRSKLALRTELREYLPLPKP